MPGADGPPRKGRLRRTREAQLLDLGALVYELHRRGERAPELLQQKAGQLDAVDEQVRGPRGEETGAAPCPACGADAESDQLVCTSCGSRLALGRRRAGRTVGALVALAAVVLLGAGASGYAVSEIGKDGDEDNGAAAERPVPAPAASAGAPQRVSRAEAPAGGAPQEPRRSLLLDWPAGLTAHTVVLVTTSDRPAALRLARSAAKSGIETGMLRSDDYDLGTGLWIVFAGRFDTARGATRQASDLAERFPGAYPQRVEPVG